MNPIETLAHYYYALPNSRLNGVYTAIVIDYAGQMRGREVWLPESEVLSLETAGRLQIDGKISFILFANTAGEKYPSIHLLRDAKAKVLWQRNFLTSAHVEKRALPCTNTITEAEAIIEAHPAISDEKILLIGDWRHIPRAVAIWKELLPCAEIAHISVDGQWTGSNHPSPFVRWNTPFLLMNLVHHAALKILGLKRLRGLKQVKQ